MADAGVEPSMLQLEALEVHIESDIESRIERRIESDRMNLSQAAR